MRSKEFVAEKGQDIDDIINRWIDNHQSCEIKFLCYNTPRCDTLDGFYYRTSALIIYKDVH